MPQPRTPAGVPGSYVGFRIRVGPRQVAALVLTASAVLSGAGPAAAQQPATTRTVTVAAGVGTSVGWYGVQLEPYLLGGRASLVLGAGYTPELTDGDPSGATFAVCARAYTSGVKHRALGGLCYAQIVTTTARLGPTTIEAERHYGPALLVGYQYTAASGFTVLAAGGIGIAPDAPGDDSSPIFPALDLAVGYTWRRDGGR